MSNYFDCDLVTFSSKYSKYENLTNADKMHAYIGILSHMCLFFPGSYYHSLAA